MLGYALLVGGGRIAQDNVPLLNLVQINVVVSCACNLQEYVNSDAVKDIVNQINESSNPAIVFGFMT